MMRKGGGKAKGSSFERKICKALSLWISKGEDEDLFWRSAMSGGRATTSAKSGKLLRRQCGDISAVSPEGHKLTDYFYVELKHVKDLAFDSFILKKAGSLYKFWLTAKREAKRYNRNPMIIAKQNNYPEIVVVLEGSFQNVNEVALVRGAIEVYLLDDVLKDGRLCTDQ